MTKMLCPTCCHRMTTTQRMDKETKEPYTLFRCTNCGSEFRRDIYGVLRRVTKWS